MVAPAVLRALRKNKTLRYGVPMLLLVVGGSFGLREFSQIRYDAVKIKIDPELEKKLKVNKITLESEYEDSDPDTWYKASTSLPDLFRPGPSTAAEALPSPMASPCIPSGTPALPKNAKPQLYSMTPS
ncbi:cytochrome c oxidase assembly protein COX16 homolog, mitochondrial isoform X1 [Psammomys obesus]|uniref:cytochrome c oxidase assembly protein COX16 homolog, mitochondrial isoform X1 n=1 Tax=Psammomys obesus TaxID=48139 RepID=UPI0024532008|nr:cytochrome c oxidase assembly protein COX16 homolog, mitochondrial isoform X1 [Psammomys obesus]